MNDEWIQRVMVLAAARAHLLTTGFVTAFAVEELHKTVARFQPEPRLPTFWVFAWRPRAKA